VVVEVGPAPEHAELGGDREHLGGAQEDAQARLRIAVRIHPRSARARVAVRIIALEVPGNEVAVYRVHRNQTFQLSFYLGHGLREWSPADTSSNVSLVVAGQDEMVPFAQPLSLFPGQRLRLWQLIGLRIETQNPPRP